LALFSLDEDKQNQIYANELDRCENLKLSHHLEFVANEPEFIQFPNKVEAQKQGIKDKPVQRNYRILLNNLAQSDCR